MNLSTLWGKRLLSKEEDSNIFLGFHFPFFFLADFPRFPFSLSISGFFSPLDFSPLDFSLFSLKAPYTGIVITFPCHYNEGDNDKDGNDGKDD